MKGRELESEKQIKEVKEFFKTGIQPLEHYVGIMKGRSVEERVAQILRKLDGIDFKLNKLIERKSCWHWDD